MRIQKCLIILFVDHVAGCYDNVLLGHTLNLLNIFKISVDISIINGACTVVLCEEHLNSSALGVDVVMATGSDMLYNGTWS